MLHKHNARSLNLDFNYISSHVSPLHKHCTFSMLYSSTTKCFKNEHTFVIFNSFYLYNLNLDLILCFVLQKSVTSNH